MAPKAQHFFLVNDQLESKTVKLEGPKGPAVDALTGEAVNLDALEVPGEDAVWIRIET